MPTDIPKASCPHCAYGYDRTTPADGVDTPPTEGDASICIRCGDIGIFTAALTIRKPTNEERRGILEANPELREWQRNRVSLLGQALGI